MPARKTTSPAPARTAKKTPPKAKATKKPAAKASKPRAQKPPPARSRKGRVQTGVERDIKTLQLPEDAGTAGLEALVVELACQIDNKRNSATAKSMCGRVLFDALAQMRQLAPVKEQDDQICEFEARLAAKRASLA